ncbi:hypothetical protein LTR36_004371 [Oleoguttula mirabilis]|uniref:Chromatin assembly factor 1 subunit A dimerization domain-containing protein n=1 Tax=Oleoguttula mirabilis TaxID=1507867 RepID=A0AAV9JGR9_9PEZI|nr:hypothetical protein LTR36_004371 [Oleoguttula mirabilis]
MEDIDSSPTSPNPLKRAAPDEDTPGKRPLNLKGTQFVMPTPPDTEGSSNDSPTNIEEQERAGSPAPSTISTLSSVEVLSSIQIQPTGTPSSTSKQPPAKRRKLTPSEKLDKEREKEAKELEKAEQKAKKDDEKRVKDEEKRKKAEEREAKKREKDLEEQRKSEDKLKKERSQMRLGAFFGAKPLTPAKSSGAGGAACSAFARRKSLSLEPFEAVADQIRKSASPTKGKPLPVCASEQQVPASSSKPSVPDYQRYFLPFELPTHSSLAHTFNIPNPDDLAYWQGAFDDELKYPSFQEKVDLGLIEPTAVVDHMFKADQEAPRGVKQPSLRSLVDQIQGTAHKPVDLTQEAPSQAPVHALQNVSRRHLQFDEDVRPPYFGTYTKIKSPRTSRRLMLNPFVRGRSDTDYDYDSEAEWEEPEEGEDILGDEEDEAESNSDPDEMDAFLDDEEDASKSKRRMITGDLQPASTGLCWEGAGGVVVQSIEGEEFLGRPKEMQGMRLGVLIPGFGGQTIDPFSTAYWATDMAPPALPIADAPRSTNGLLGSTARPPLQERHSNGLPSQSLLGAAEGEKGPITSLAASQGSKRGPKPQPKALSKEDLDEFKEAVTGSPVAKIELCKALKLR